MTERAANRPVFLLLAVLILGGLAWWLWPAGDREADESAVADASGELGETGVRKLEPKRLDLAHEPKASVSGTVRAFGGGPLVDAQVCARPYWGELRGLGDGEPKCARTGQDGHYRIEGLWPVRMQFSASAAKHEPKAWRTKDARGRWQDDVRLVAGSETKAIDFELASGGVRLTGMIKDLGGGEIEGALVEATTGRGMFGAGKGSAIGLSDAEGRFELWVAAGNVGVSASADGYAPAYKRTLAPSERVELFLTPESVLVGRVVHAETGEGVPDVTVSAGSSDFFRGGGEPVRSDADGNFQIHGLGPGTYKPTANSDHFYGQAAEQVHLGLGQTSAPIELRVHPMALVEGRIVVAGTDEGCRSGSVTLTRADKGEQAWAQTDEQGRVVLRGVRPGEYEVEVGCEDYVAGDDYPNLVIAGDDQLEHVWEVREGQAIRGVIVDGDGQPVADASISAQGIVDAANARAQTTSSWSGESEDDGSFELAGLLPGRYEVSVWAEQPAPDAPLVVELEPGADRNDVRIELLATGSIAGRVIDEQGTPQPGASVRATPPGKWAAASAMTDDEGKFLIEHVRTGENRVQASTGQWGGNSMRAPGSSDDDVQGERVEVAVGQTVDVELRVESRTGVIRGKVLDEGGAPVDDAFIHAERMSDSATANAGRSRNAVRWDWASEPILTDADGSFTIDELAPGSYVIRAHRRGGGEAIVEGVAVGSSVELTIESTGVLAGKVVVTGGSPPEKFRVSVSDRKQGLSSNDEFFRTTGTWQLSELPAGKYEISVESNLGTAMIEVELEAGGRHEDLELVLQPRVTVRGRLIDIDSQAPIPGMQVRITPLAGSNRMMMSGSDKGGNKEVSDAEGRFEVEHAPTGEVRIFASPRAWGDTSDYDWSFFVRTVADDPAIQELGDFELIKRRLDPEQAAGDLGFETKQVEPGTKPEAVQLKVGLIRPGSPAAATELAIGDVIESVDGKSVEGADSSRYQQLTRVPAGTQLVLGIAGDKTVTITVGPPIK